MHVFFNKPLSQVNTIDKLYHFLFYFFFFLNYSAWIKTYFREYEAKKQHIGKNKNKKKIQ